MAEKSTRESGVFARLMQAHTSACPDERHNATTLGKWCGVPVYKMRRVRNGESQLRYDEIMTIAGKTGLEVAWISTGKMPVWQAGRTAAVVPLPAPGPDPDGRRDDDAPQSPCRQCLKLEQELEREREERRELVREARELNRQVAALLRENGDLRAQLARLEERGPNSGVTGCPAADSGAA